MCRMYMSLVTCTCTCNKRHVHATHTKPGFPEITICILLWKDRPPVGGRRRPKRRPPWNQRENALARPSHTLLPCAAADKTRRTRRDGALSLLVHLLERGAPRCSTLASFKLNLRFRGLPGGGPRISSPLFKVGTYFILMAGGCMKYTWNIHGTYNCSHSRS